MIASLFKITKFEPSISILFSWTAIANYGFAYHVRFSAGKHNQETSAVLSM